MGIKKENPTDVGTTIFLNLENNDTVNELIAYAETKEMKNQYSKCKAINRIIREWREDRIITLDIKKKK